MTNFDSATGGFLLLETTTFGLKFPSTSPRGYRTLDRDVRTVCIE